ncbi:MAG: single-stranded DNA-binding protein [Verrucomicrobia bacterium]|nr:single-stranded DNA-binding protein [Verrucomicrobiota bacterium]MDE3046786.1 single-stranded DNA-binding protein [Verrucomicrobiota bacterium]
MNFIHIAGNLGADPEVRFTSSGKKVTTMKVATRSRRGKNGEDITIWWRVTVWGEQFDKMISFLKKGSAVMVYGDVHKPEIFTDREGKPQVSLDITAVHLEFSPFGSGKPQNNSGEAQKAAPAPTGPVAPFGAAPMADSPINPYMKAGAPQGKGETFDDEVPF